MRHFLKSRKCRMISSVMYPVLFGVIIFVLWETQILHSIMNTSTDVLPVPSKIASVIGENITKLMGNLWITTVPTLIGLAVGSALGYAVAVIASIFTKWGGGGITLVSCFNAVPIVALAPIFNNLCKHVSTDIGTRGMAAKALVVMMLCMASMSINAFRGLTELPPFSTDMMKSYASSKRVTFVKLRLPNSVPYIFTALRVSVPISVISALVSEYFIDTREGSATFCPGLGRMIRDTILKCQYSAAWSYIAIACLLGITLFVVLMIFESVMLKNRQKQ